MVTSEGLFTIVNNNDYINLNKLTKNGELSPCLNIIRLGISIIHKAIEYRSKECFDILIEQNNLTVLKNESSHVTGLYIAMKYYNSAQNESNWYYVDKLLSKGVNITIDVLKTINDRKVFNKIFENMDKNKDKIVSILKYLISTNKMDQLEDVYFWLINQELEYLNSDIKRKKFFEDLFCIAIKSNNFEMIDILRSEKIDLKLVKENNLVTNSLFYALKEGNKESFQYLINFYKDLNQEDFDKIKDIKDLSLLIDKCSSHEITFLLCKLISFKYDLGDQTNFIENIIRKIFYSRHINRKINIHDINDNYLLIIFILGINNFIKQNPLNNLISNVETFEKEYLNCLSYFKSLFTGRLKELRYILEYLKFPIPEKFSYIIKATDSTNYIKEKFIYIGELSNKLKCFRFTLEE